MLTKLMEYSEIANVKRLHLPGAHLLDFLQFAFLFFSFGLAWQKL